MPAGQCQTVTPPEAKSSRRLVVLAGEREAGDSCSTFIFHKENHTLGNALRHVLLQNPRVMFAGYSIPHPAEDQMHIRIQTVEDYPPLRMFRVSRNAAYGNAMLGWRSERSGCKSATVL